MHLAHSNSALKRWRQNGTHRIRNKAVRSAARTAVKRAQAVIDQSGADDARAAIAAAVTILDRAAKRNVVHKNAASRHKSRLMLRLNKAGALAAEAPKQPRRTTRTTGARTRGAAKPRTTATRTRGKKS